MSGINDVQDAFNAVLTALLPGAKIVHENEAIDTEEQAQTPETWYKATFLPGEPEQEEGIEGGLMSHAGIYQVSLFRPKASDAGDAQIRDDAQAIVSRFHQGTLIGDAVCLKAWASETDDSDDTWVGVHVRVRWQADLET